MYNFIINPVSGKGMAMGIWDYILSRLNNDKLEFAYDITQYEGHAFELAENAVVNGHRKLICVGGDGTFNEMVNGIISKGDNHLNAISVGMIPTGTGNDWCRIHKIPHDPLKAYDIIMKNNIANQDIGKINFIASPDKPRYFVNVAGAGFDAIVAKNVNIDKRNGKNGIILFAKNLITSLFKSEYHNCRITMDGKRTEMEVFTIAVGIGKYNGGGMKQLPAAVHDDGLFDVTVITDISKFDVLRYAPLLFNGKFIRHPKVFTYRCKEIIIESENNLLIEAEGESAGTLPVKIEIIPSALRVYSGL